MPEVHFRVRWPDGSVERLYSPSTVITEHLDSGVRYPLEEFVERARRALTEASERVHSRFGLYCSSAQDQLAAIEARAGRFEHSPNARVLIEGFETGATRAPDHTPFSPGDSAP